MLWIFLARVLKSTFAGVLLFCSPAVLSVTGSVSGSGSHYAILKNNVDLKWANEKLLKENAALKARVNILLDMLVQKTSQLKLLKMACVDASQSNSNP